MIRRLGTFVEFSVFREAFQRVLAPTDAIKVMLEPQHTETRETLHEG
jgi:hypothetical protein